MALQVGGALGVAVIGSVLSTRYQDHMSAALAGRHVPTAAAHTILGSLGGALAVAAHAGGAAGALLAYTSRAAFMSGTEMALAVGAAVALGGAVLVIARLPSRVPRDLPDVDCQVHDEHDGGEQVPPVERLWEDGQEQWGSPIPVEDPRNHDVDRDEGEDRIRRQAT